MAKESFISLRRFTAIGFVLLLLSFCLSLAATAQTQVPAPPYVISSAGFTPEHTFAKPARDPIITGAAVAPNGDVVFVDLGNNHLYHFPADGRPMQDVGWISNEHDWKNNYGISIDSKMNLYVGGNYAINGVFMLPYDSVNKTWSMSSAVNFINGGGLVPDPPDYPQLQCTSNCWGFQPGVVAVDSQDNLVIGTVGGAPKLQEIFTVPVVDGAANLAGGQVKVYGLKSRASSIAADSAGNIFFVEDGQPGVFMLPAGQLAVGDGTGSMEYGTDGLPTPPLVRLDPLAANSPAVPDPTNKAIYVSGYTQGVAVDAAGNVYFGDQYTGFNDPNVAGGIWMIPNESGTLNPAHALLVAPIAVRGALAIDNKTGAIWTSVSGTWNGLKEVAKITVGYADLGSSAVGVQGSPITIFNAFNTNVTTNNPDVSLVFKILPPDAGSAASLMDVGGGSCNGGDYHQNDRCTFMVALKPQFVGPIQGGLAAMQSVCIADCGDPDHKIPVELKPYPVVSTMTLHGVGLGGNLAFFSNPVQSTVGSAISGSGQVTTDKAGNVYVTAATSVLMYPANATAATAPVEVGKNLTAPTGVAVDGLGNVYIADSGSIVEVPCQLQADNTTCQLNADAQAAIKTGLGASVKLAMNPAGWLFVSDPDNGRVLRIRMVYPPYQPATIAPPASGVAVQPETELIFAGVTGIGVDAAGNLLIADGTNVIRVDDRGQQTAIANSVGAANGLAMDPSGALYYSTSSGAFRVPVVGGALSVGDKLALGTGVTAVSGIALGARNRVYLADSTASNLHIVGVDGTLDFGSIELGDAPSLDSSVYNVGNTDITFTVGTDGFPGSVVTWMGMTSVDFTTVPSLANGCADATSFAAGSTCSVTTTFNPDNGEEAALSRQFTITSTTNNGPVVLNVAGNGAALAGSHTAMVVDPSVNANSAPITVTVTPATGTGTPTGDVMILIDGVPIQRKTLGADGTVSLNLFPVKAGNHEYTAAYRGDRVYGRSTSVQTIAVAKGVTRISQPEVARILGDSRAGWIPYVLTNIQNADAYYYKWPVSVIAGEAGIPTPSECTTYATGTACGKVLLLDSDQFAQQSVGVSPNTGIAEVSSSNFKPIQDSKALHPVSWYTVTPVYFGDDNYLPSTGTPVTFAVLRSPSVWIARTDSSSTSVNVTASAPATATFSATSMLGYGVVPPYTGQVEFKCDNLPAYASCSFAPARVSVTEGAPGSTTVTIRTNVPVGSVVAQHKTMGGWVFAAMFGFGAIGLVFGRKTRLNGRLLTIICALLIVTAALAGMTACSTSSGASPNPAAVTPAGTYAVTVTAQEIGANPSGNGWEQDWAAVPYSITVNVQ